MILVEFRENIKQKVLIMTLPQTADVTGGSISIFFELSNLLANNNYEITGACYGDSNNRPGKLDKKVEYINLFYYYSKEKKYSEAMNAYIDELKPDLIIFFFPYLLFDAKLDSKFNNIPKILMFHSRPDYYAAQDSNFIENLKKYSKNTVFQILLPSYRALLPKCIKKEDIVCIPNFVDTSKDKVNSMIEKKKIAYLSRVDMFKGCEFLIKSFSKIAKKYPDWQLDIWGQSEPASYIEELKKLVRKNKLDNQLFFKGVTNKPLETLLEYDFCVFPSIFEGFPVGLVEMLGVGLPAVGLKGASGVNELIIDGYNGFLTKRNENEFAKRIEELINDKEKRNLFSKNAILSTKQYDIKYFNERWLKLVSYIFTEDKLETQQFNGNATKYELFPVSLMFETSFKKKLESIPFYKKFFSKTKFNIWGVKYKIIYILGKKFVIKKEMK